MQELLIGTSNPGKTKLYQELLAKFSPTIHTVTTAERNFSIRVAETGSTFEENATLKARAWAKAANLPALSVDGGMMIAALDGAPGVLTNRWAGEHRTDEEKISFLLEKLRNVPLPERTVTWREVVAVAKPNGEVLIENAEDVGLILENPVPLPNDWRGLWVLPLWFVPTHGKPWLSCTQEEREKTDSTSRILRKLQGKLEKFLI